MDLWIFDDVEVFVLSIHGKLREGILTDLQSPEDYLPHSV